MQMVLAGREQAPCSVLPVSMVLNTLWPIFKCLQLFDAIALTVQFLITSKLFKAFKNNGNTCSEFFHFFPCSLTYLSLGKPLRVGNGLECVVMFRIHVFGRHTLLYTVQ